MVTQTALEPFLGPDVNTGYDRARVVILPIPYEATTTYRRGCQRGPAAILNASQQVEYYDEELEEEVWPVGIYTHPPICDTGVEPELSAQSMLDSCRAVVCQLAQAGKFVVSLGGEHSITTGIVQGYLQAGLAPFTVVQIDAHTDLRDEYEGSKYNHACVMRRIVDLGVPTVQIGVRSLCREEADFVRSQGLMVLRAREIAADPLWSDRALAAVATRRVFLTVDLDGIDPTLIPGVGTPEPGGLNWYSLLGFCRRLFADYEVIGADIMELAPVQDSVVSEFTAAKLAHKLIGYKFLVSSP